MSIADLRRQLTEIGMEIMVKTSAIARLEEARTALQQQLHAMSTYPVLTLPVEIITYFLSARAPVVFLGVCRAWRDIALATSVLWTTFGLRLHNIHEDFATEPGKLEGFIEGCLERAALRPLSVILYDFGSPRLSPNRLHDIIQRYAHRIQYLELGTSEYDISELGLNSLHFPLFQRAVVLDHSLADSSDPVPVYGNAPQLREFLLAAGAIFSSYTFPSLQLTKFQGEIDSLQLFIAAPNLTEAKCATEYFHYRGSLVVFHPRLQSLTIQTSHHSRPPVDLLPHLTLPALEFLHISRIQDSVANSLHQFLARSSPPLCTLSARVQDDTLADWEPCFSCIGATLENLKLHSPDSLFQHTLLYLGPYDSESTSTTASLECLPRLRTLNIAGSPGVDFETLVSFLNRRSSTPSVAKIRSFRVVCTRGSFLQDRFTALGGELPEEGINHLANLANRGIDIHIGTQSKIYVKHVRHVPGDIACTWSAS
ncbi:hypothetical protein B0H19DRAFT_1257140 [Mycena capillaripes]|nr:hypothetical protein B0H19DRAFT_1257140 [Mycena capillaripes]